MLVQCSLLLHLQFYCAVNGWFQSEVYLRWIVAKITISPANAMLSMCGWLPMLVQCCLLLHLQFYSTVNGWFQSKVYFCCIVVKITISPPNSMSSMCCWLPMLVQCSLLLHLQFHCPENGWFESEVYFRWIVANLTFKFNASPISLSMFSGSSPPCHIVQLLGLQIEVESISQYLFIYFGTLPSFIKNSMNFPWFSNVCMPPDKAQDPELHSSMEFNFFTRSKGAGFTRYCNKVMITFPSWVICRVSIHIVQRRKYYWILFFKFFLCPNHFFLNCL